MSEYTEGTLFLTRSTTLVEDHLKHLNFPYLIRQLNDKWSAFFFQDDSLIQLDTAAAIWVISYTTPLLHFVNNEDIGWGYTVYYRGGVVAAVDVNYDLDYAIAWDKADEQGYDLDVTVDQDGYESIEPMLHQVRDSVEYQRALEGQYADRNLDALKLFDLSPETVAHLDEILTAEYADDDPTCSAQVTAFKEELGIAEMAWMSYQYLTEDRDE